MDYIAPTTLDEAYGALAVADARCLAGGQSLVAMMNLGLAAPARLVSLRKIAALRGIDPAGRWRAASRCDDDARRNRGARGKRRRTVAACAGRPSRRLSGRARAGHHRRLGRECRSGGRLSGRTRCRGCGHRDRFGFGVSPHRRARFLRGLFETALAPRRDRDRDPSPAGTARCARQLHEAIGRIGRLRNPLRRSHRRGHGRRRHRRLCGDAAALVGYRVSDEALLAVGRAIAASCDPPSDHRTSPEYRRRVLPELLRRTVRAALS